MNHGLNKNRHQDLGTVRNYQVNGYELNKMDGSGYYF